MQQRKHEPESLLDWHKYRGDGTERASWTSGAIRLGYKENFGPWPVIVKSVRLKDDTCRCDGVDIFQRSGHQPGCYFRESHPQVIIFPALGEMQELSAEFFMPVAQPEVVRADWHLFFYVAAIVTATVGLSIFGFSENKGSPGAIIGYAIAALATAWCIYHGVHADPAHQLKHQRSAQ